MRYGVILAKLATEVAPIRAYGKYPTAGMEVIERLFFDGVKVYRGGQRVINRDQRTADVAFAPAYSGFTIAKQTLEGAKQALDTPFIPGAPVGRDVSVRSGFHCGKPESLAGSSVLSIRFNDLHPFFPEIGDDSLDRA